jgi:hypothetical protein
MYWPSKRTPSWTGGRMAPALGSGSGDVVHFSPVPLMSSGTTMRPSRAQEITKLPLSSSCFLSLTFHPSCFTLSALAVAFLLPPSSLSSHFLPTGCYISAGPRQHSDIWYRVAWDSWPHFTVAFSCSCVSIRTSPCFSPPPFAFFSLRFSFLLLPIFLVSYSSKYLSNSFLSSSHILPLI